MASAKPILLFAAALLLTGCASTPRDIGNLCKLFEDRRSWFTAAQRAEQRWSVPIPVTMAFIQQESGFRKRARPPRTRLFGFIPGPRPSDAFGYAQALDSTWDDYQQATGRWAARRSDFGDAVDFIGWYNSNSYRINGIAQSDAYSLYLAYHEGNAGFTRRSYEGKAWLLDVANTVQANTNLYERQLGGCERELNRGWFRRLFS